MSTTPEDLRKALDLLQRVEDASSEAPDPEWYRNALVCKLRGQLEQANQSLDTANAALNLYGNQIQARDAVIVELNGIIERSLGKELSALRLAQDLAHGGPEHDDTHTPVEWRVFIQIYNNQGEQYATEPEIRESKLLAVAGLAVAAIQSSRRKRDA